jgi:hypothetical protein
MNSVLVCVALIGSPAQCADNHCAVDVSVTANHSHGCGVRVSGGCAAGARIKLPGQPVRRLVALGQRIRHNQPVRSFFRTRQPVRRALGRLFGGCRGSRGCH